jgi:hypothetical protein
VVTRVVEVPPGRLVGWVERYAATHPGTVATPVDGRLQLAADGGASASLVPLLPFRPDLSTAADGLVPALAAHASRPIVLALLLIRRGGYAVGVACGGELLTSKVGSRYVQSRTAAGGWSQQRFARRREGQARDLVRAAAEAWSNLPRERTSSSAPAALVTGGDRTLCEQVLAERAARDLLALGSLRHLDVPDPRLAVLQEAARRAMALVVTVREP